MAKEEDITKKESLASQLKSDEQSIRSNQETWKRWSQLTAQVWTDEKLKQRLIATPAAVLQEHGLAIPAGMDVRVVENTDKVFYLTLPAKPAGGVTELTSSELAGAVGGVSCSGVCTQTCIIHLPEPPSYTQGICMPSPIVGPV
jgi:Nitrile hydratase, alpha chain